MDDMIVYVFFYLLVIPYNNQCNVGTIIQLSAERARGSLMSRVKIGFKMEDNKFLFVANNVFSSLYDL